MNIITDEKIELDVPADIELYRKEIRNIFRPILQKYSLKFKTLGFITWVLLVLGLLVLIFHTKKIAQILCLTNMDLVYNGYLFVAFPFMLFLFWAVIRQNLLMKYFYGSIEYFQNPTKFYANQTSVLFTADNGGIKNEYTWQNINDIYLNKTGDIVLNLAGVNLTLLPQATFKNTEQKQQVFNQLKIWHSNAKTAFT